MISLLTRAHLCLAAALAVTACSIDDVADDEELVERGAAIGSLMPNANGLDVTDGFHLVNGVNMPNGLATSTGLNVGRGLATAAGLSSTGGLMMTEAGQVLVKSIVECALPMSQSIVKADPLHGGKRVFSGRLGLAPAWQSGACDTSCQQVVSACLLARSNAQGDEIMVDLRGPQKPLGVAGSGPEYAVQEGAFYGNLFANPPRAFACKGVDATFGVFEDRTCGDAASCAIQGIEEHCKDKCSKGAGNTFGACLEGTYTYGQVITTYLDPTPWTNGCPPGCDACDVGVCTFICTDDEPCTSELLECPIGWDCEVVCDGADTCKAAKVDCTAATECAMTCLDAHSCMGARLDCGVGDCNLACDSAESCKFTRMRVTGAGDATMTCSGASTGELCADLAGGSCTTIGC